MSSAARIADHRGLADAPDGSRRWRVELRGLPGLDVELPAAERASLDLTDDELHELLPTALERHGIEQDPDVPWDAPVRLYAHHFLG